MPMPVVPACEELLSTARDLVRLSASCSGPAGRSKFLQVGTDTSQVVVTSSGSRLFGEACSLALHSAPSRVLADAAISQAKNFGDGSLFVANLACRLLVEALDPRAEGGGSGGGGRGDLHATREGFALALTWSLEYLNSPRCSVRVPIRRKTPPNHCQGDEETTRVMVALAAGMLGSKPVCRLRATEIRRLAELTVTAFRASLGEGDDGRAASNVRVLPVLGPPCRKSETIYDAILVETPLPAAVRRIPSPSSPAPAPFQHPGEFPPFFLNPQEPCPSGGNERETGDLLPSGCFRQRCRLEGMRNVKATTQSWGWAALNRPVSVALFGASLQMEIRDPFDLEPRSGLHAEFSSEVGGRDNAGAGAWTAGERELQELEALARALVDVGAGVVACQRLIHPHLRRCLSERGVLPLERLSAANVAAFQKITGARLIGSWLGPKKIRRTDLGAAGLVTVRHLHGRSFLDVSSAGDKALAYLQSSIDVGAVRKRRQPVSTLVLCAPDNSALDELKATTDGLMRVLLHTTQDQGVALAGAGCWEVHLASHLRERAKLFKRPAPLKPPSFTLEHGRLRTSPSTTMPKPPPLPAAVGRRIGRRRFDSPPPLPPAPKPLPLRAAVDGRVGRAGRRRLDSPPPLPPTPKALLVAAAVGGRVGPAGRRRLDSPPPPPSAQSSAPTPEECIGQIGCAAPAYSGPDPGAAWISSRGLECEAVFDRIATKPGQGGGEETDRRREGDIVGERERERELGSILASANAGNLDVCRKLGERFDSASCWSIATTCLAPAIDRFASCLEASACRRGSNAPLPPGSCGSGGHEGRVSVGATAAVTGNTSGLLLPVEVLLAVRRANSIRGGEDGTGGGTYRGERAEGNAGGGGSAPLRLWGVDEDGQAVKEVVLYGEAPDEERDYLRGNVLLSAGVLDGFSSRVRGLESAVETCMCLMLAEGTVYADA